MGDGGGWIQIGERGAWHALHADHPVYVAHTGPDVILGVLVAVVAHHLRVSARDVKRLDEGLHGEFPVAGQDFCDMGCLVTVLEAEVLEVFGKDFKIALQRLTVCVEIDEDEAAP